MYNEEIVIREVVLKLLNSLEGLNEEWELIVVNDGSVDNSLKIVEEIAKENKHLKVISYPKNRGRGYALRMGFKNAKGDIIVTTEADLSWGEDIIFRLVSKLKDNQEVDAVIASPHMQGGGYRNVPFYRRFLSSVGNAILAKAFSENLTMVTGMTRAYRKEVIESIDLENDGKEIHLEIASKITAIGFRIVEIPAVLTWKKMKGDKKRKSSFNARKLIFSHLLFGFSEAPLLFLGIIGLIFIILGLIIGVYIIYIVTKTHLITNRPLVTLMTLLIITGIQILIFSFLAYQNKNIQKNLVRMQKQILELTTAEDKKNKEEKKE